jgi:hypothetical protein
MKKVTGISIPHRRGTGTAAKDAFFYLLTFATLATWTIGLGALAFSLIDRWLADTLFSTPYYQAYDLYSMAEAIASIIVAFPIYLLVTRTILRDETDHPEKLNSPVRKWLTYMALVIAAGIFIGDLITALTYFLRGEITSRFLAKAFVVLAISSGVFFYYFYGLRRSEENESRGKGRRPEVWMTGLSSIVILVMVLLGFAQMGAPKTQRVMRADGKRVQDLYQLASQINGSWNSNSHKLPQHLDELSNAVYADPVTRASYEYRPIDENHYELCATFALDSKRNEMTDLSKWSHPAGHYCYSLNASQPLETPNIYAPD